MDHVDVTFHIDPGCPFGYSAWPALSVLHWRFGDQLRWKTVMIGLAEDPEEYDAKGFDPLFLATAQLDFREHGMPFAITAKPRLWATSPACRAIVAVRLRRPDRETAALRALQFAQFTSGALLDEPDDLREALEPLGLAEAVDRIEAEGMAKLGEGPARLSRPVDPLETAAGAAHREEMTHHAKCEVIADDIGARDQDEQRRADHQDRIDGQPEPMLVEVPCQLSPHHRDGVAPLHVVGVQQRRGLVASQIPEQALLGDALGNPPHRASFHALHPPVPGACGAAHAPVALRFRQHLVKLELEEREQSDRVEPVHQPCEPT